MRIKRGCLSNARDKILEKYLDNLAQEPTVVETFSSPLWMSCWASKEYEFTCRSDGKTKKVKITIAMEPEE